jgi:hypothetical protein
LRLPQSVYIPMIVPARRISNEIPPPEPQFPRNFRAIIGRMGP